MPIFLCSALPHSFHSTVHSITYSHEAVTTLFRPKSIQIQPIGNRPLHGRYLDNMTDVIFSHYHMIMYILLHDYCALNTVSKQRRKYQWW